MTTTELEDKCGGVPCRFPKKAFPTDWLDQPVPILKGVPRWDPEHGFRWDEMCEAERLVSCALKLLIEDQRFTKFAVCVATGQPKKADCVMKQLNQARFSVILSKEPSPDALAAVINVQQAKAGVKGAAIFGGVLAAGLQLVGAAAGPVGILLSGLLGAAAGAGAAATILVATIKNVHLYVSNPKVANWVGFGLKGAHEEIQCARIAVLLLHEIMHLCGVWLQDAILHPSSSREDCRQTPVIAQRSLGWLLGKRYGSDLAAPMDDEWYSSLLGYPGQKASQAGNVPACASLCPGCA